MYRELGVYVVNTHRYKNQVHTFSLVYKICSLQGYLFHITLRFEYILCDHSIEFQSNVRDMVVFLFV